VSQAQARLRRPPKSWRAALILSLVTVLFALAGCESGTLVGQEQTCEVSGGFLSEGSATCAGTVDAVRGSPQLVIVDTDEELDGTYRLEATLSVGKGETKAHVTAADGDRVGGVASPGEPLRISADVEVDDEDEEVAAELKVAGKEAADLRYEASLTPPG
jgi:hypothetical protein